MVNKFRKHIILEKERIDFFFIQPTQSLFLKVRIIFESLYIILKHSILDFENNLQFLAFICVYMEDYLIY